MKLATVLLLVLALAIPVAGVNGGTASAGTNLGVAGECHKRVQRFGQGFTSINEKCMLPYKGPYVGVVGAAFGRHTFNGDFVRVQVMLIWQAHNEVLASCDSGKHPWVATCEHFKRSHKRVPPVGTPILCQIYAEAFFAAGPGETLTVSAMCSSVEP
jgi:hypothetical protein